MVDGNFVADVDIVAGNVVEGDNPDDERGLVVELQVCPTAPVSAHI